MWPGHKRSNQQRCGHPSWSLHECITTSIHFSLLRGSNHNGQSCNLFCNPENTLECIMAVYWEEATTDYIHECITTSALEVLSALQSSGRKQQLTTCLSASLQVHYKCFCCEGYMEFLHICRHSSITYNYTVRVSFTSVGSHFIKASLLLVPWPSSLWEYTMCIKLLHRHTSINLAEEALILAPIQLLMGCLWLPWKHQTT